MIVGIQLELEQSNDGGNTLYYVYVYGVESPSLALSQGASTTPLLPISKHHTAKLVPEELCRGAVLPRDIEARLQPMNSGHRSKCNGIETH